MNSSLTPGEKVTTRQHGVKQTVQGVYQGTNADGFALVRWVTRSGRPVVGRFPLANTQRDLLDEGTRLLAAQAARRSSR